MSSRCLGSMITLFLSSLSLLLFWESDGIRYVTFRNDGEATSLNDSIRIKLSVHQPLSVLCRDIRGGGGSHTDGKRRERRVLLFLIPFPIRKTRLPTHTDKQTDTTRKPDLCVGCEYFVVMVISSVFTLVKKEFIHLVKVFFWMWSRSSCNTLMRPCSNLSTSSRCDMVIAGRDYAPRQSG